MSVHERMLYTDVTHCCVCGKYCSPRYNAKIESASECITKKKAKIYKKNYKK